MIVFGKQNLMVLASLTLLLSLSTAGSAKIPGMALLKKDNGQIKATTETKPVAKAPATPAQKPVAKAVPQEEPIVSERLRAAAQNLIAARKQVAVARAQLKAAEAEYKVAKFELGAIALRKEATGMANSATKTESLAQNAPAPLATNDLLPAPAPAKSSLAPAPGWNKASQEDVSIDDLDLP
jgi:hypothetical protein